MEGRIVQLCDATTFGPLIRNTLLDVARAIHDKYSRDPTAGAALFWTQIGEVMDKLLEGQDGVSGIRHMWVSGQKLNTVPVGCPYDFRLIDNPPPWAFPPNGEPPMGRRVQPDKRIHFIEDDPVGNIYAISYINNKRTLPVYASKEEAMAHAKEPCHFHVQAMVENQKRPMTREEAERICHPNSLCVSEHNKYIECTEVTGGADAIRRRAAMPNGPERNTLYQEQLDQVNLVGKRRTGARINVMMEVMPSVMEEVEIGTECL